MSGSSDFINDVVSILKTNLMYHREALGYISGSRELLDHLQGKGFPVTDRRSKYVDRFDYHVLRAGWHPESIVKALSSLNIGGVIIIETSGGMAWEEEYLNREFGFKATKVRYGGREYIVIHIGGDYGN